MCIIAAKPAGVKMPSMETIETMWRRNPDGAGFMYVNPQKNTPTVRVEKGFMKLSSFKARIEELGRSIDLTEAPVVMHFRITTHGGTCPENCHPFPVTDSVGVLKKLRSNTALGVAHNGIIDIRPRKDISDTMEYILSQLAPLSKALPRFYENKHAMRMVENAIDSKMAFLNSEGHIYTIGHFVKDEGIMYSNTTFRSWWDDPRYGYACYGDDWDCYSLNGSPFRTLTGGKTKGTGKTKGQIVQELDTVELALNLLSDVPGSYVTNAAGELLDGEEFAVDRHGMVYEYEPCIDAWYEHEPTWRAYKSAGLAFRFDEDLVSMEPVLV